MNAAQSTQDAEVYTSQYLGEVREIVARVDQREIDRMVESPAELRPAQRSPVHPGGT